MKALILKSIFICATLLLVNLPNASAQGGSGNTPGNSNNPGGQGGGPGNSNDPNQGSPISGVDGNQGNDKQVGNAGGNRIPIPIDGGASILLVAGAAYGLKKVRDYYKEKKADPLAN